ncbi:DUF4380 domain-containing protein [Dyadobacter frigoris]|nr:DUF4380 domain-containing protein [Dyadobacter frigoris]GLU52154.1 hypothetical protein Dfri01_16150 [Dyadobacter frigoris]
MIPNRKISIPIFLLTALIFIVEVSAQKLNRVISVEKSGKYFITIENQVMEIDPLLGGRITSLKIDGKDFLTDSTINDFNWGSTFWLSPQSAWNWPPSAEIDNKPYNISVRGNVIRMVSQKDPKTGLRVIKEISGNKKNSSFILKFIITNQSDKNQKVAPWEVTRVKSGGLSFFPIGKDKARGGLLSSTSIKNGIFYYQYQKEKLPVKGDRQIYADGSEGWLAQINDNVILIKKFPDIPLELTAPKEGEVELFASEVTAANPGYVEIEHQGPYLELKPGESSSWETTWFLRKLPFKLKPEIGNAGLIDYARKIVK